MMQTELEQAVTYIEEAVNAASHAASTETDPAKRLQAFVDLKYVADLLKKVTSGFADEVNEGMVSSLDAMGSKKHTLGSVTVERRVSNYRSAWEHNVLLRSVINTALDEIDPRTYVDQDTGEVVPEEDIYGPIVEHVVERVAKCAGIRDWRVTALKHYIPSINVDDFCETKRSVKAQVTLS